MEQNFCNLLLQKIFSKSRDYILQNAIHIRKIRQLFLIFELRLKTLFHLLKLVALSVTLVRIPIILFGIVALTSGWMWLACLSFTMFALLDYFDGVAARRTGQDTALRRIGDVLLDRVSIHVVILLTCLHYNKGWVVWSLLLARDLTQGAFSSCLLAKYRVLIIGAYWHMSYGVAILMWECTFLTSGVVSGSLSA